MKSPKLIDKLVLTLALAFFTAAVVVLGPDQQKQVTIDGIHYRLTKDFIGIITVESWFDIGRPGHAYWYYEGQLTYDSTGELSFRKNHAITWKAPKTYFSPAPPELENVF